MGLKYVGEYDKLYIYGKSGSTQYGPHLTISHGSATLIGIGTVNPDKPLTVEGDARVTGDIYYGAIGETTTYKKPDFVFNEQYDKQFDIQEIENFINKNKHLPWVTSSNDEKDGINMTRMQFETLESVENLQLQLIEMHKENKALKSKIEEQQKVAEKQQAVLQQLQKRIEKLESQ
jgi:hypothetical protein